MSKSKKKTGKPSGYNDRPGPRPTVAPFVMPVIQHSDWDADEYDRVPLFAIERDGEVTEYDMPAAENAGLWLEFLKIARTIGDELASSWLLEEVLGIEGYAALCGERDLSKATMRSISSRIVQVIGGTAPDINYTKKSDREGEDEEEADPS